MKTIGEICAEVQARSGITYDDRALGFAEEVASRVLAESILDRAPRGRSEFEQLLGRPMTTAEALMNENMKARKASGEATNIPEVKRSNDEPERRRL